MAGNAEKNTSTRTCNQSTKNVNLYQHDNTSLFNETFPSSTIGQQCNLSLGNVEINSQKSNEFPTQSKSNNPNPLSSVLPGSFGQQDIATKQVQSTEGTTVSYQYLNSTEDMNTISINETDRNNQSTASTETYKPNYKCAAEMPRDSRDSNKLNSCPRYETSPSKFDRDEKQLNEINASHRPETSTNNKRDTLNEPLTVSSVSNACWYFHAKIDGLQIPLLFDTGSPVSIISKETYDQIACNKPRFSPDDTHLKAANDYVRNTRPRHISL